jgi:hypothetical protein
MRLKRAWNVKAMECGVPYTIVSQGAFSEWLVETCPFVHHDTRTIDVVGDDPEAIGWVAELVEVSGWVEETRTGCVG